MENTYELKLTIRIDSDYKSPNGESKIGDEQPDGKFRLIYASAGAARIDGDNRATVFIEKPYGSKYEHLHNLLDYAMGTILLDNNTSGKFHFADLRGIVSGALTEDGEIKKQ